MRGPESHRLDIERVQIVEDRQLGVRGLRLRRKIIPLPAASRLPAATWVRYPQKHLDRRPCIRERFCVVDNEQRMPEVPERTYDRVTRVPV